MNLVMNICEGICVLNFGRIIAKGTPADIQSDPRSSRHTWAKRRRRDLWDPF